MSVRVPVWAPSFDEVMARRDPSAAEKKLLAACRTNGFGCAGEECPEDTGDPDRAVRAGLIRFLLLGGDQRHLPNVKGVRLQGAWIDGVLDLRGCETHLDLILKNCLLPIQPVFRDAQIGGLYLVGSQAPNGCDLQRIAVETSVYLREFHATGMVNLANAAITGQLDCSGGRFDGADRVALNVSGATVGSDVFLRGGFRATGLVNLARVRVEGGLHVQKAKIDGPFRLRSARIGNGFYWRGVKGKIPEMDLTEARVGALHDDARSWNTVKDTLKLGGFRYGSLQSSMTVNQRLAWLARNERQEIVQAPGARAYLREKVLDFDPRPYTELARAYLGMGEKHAAARVLEAREDGLRDAELRRTIAEVDSLSDWRVGPARLLWLWQWVFKGLFGYGHSPARALIAVIFYWIAATFFFQAVYDAGEFAPNSDVVLTSAGWKQAAEFGCPLAGDEGFDDAKAAGCVMPQFVWSNGMKSIHPPIPAPPEGCPAGRTVEGLAACEVPRSTSAGDYETFSALLYAADLFLPLDTIGQTEAWAPSKDRGAWGAAGYWARFPIQMFGWIMVAMAAAVLAGVIGKKEE